eukprot:25688-Pelagococcus_subviridis.AAC.1
MRSASAFAQTASALARAASALARSASARAESVPGESGIAAACAVVGVFVGAAGSAPTGVSAIGDGAGSPGVNTAPATATGCAASRRRSASCCCAASCCRCAASLCASNCAFCVSSARLCASSASRSSCSAASRSCSARARRRRNFSLFSLSTFRASISTACVIDRSASCCSLICSSCCAAICDWIGDGARSAREGDGDSLATCDAAMAAPSLSASSVARSISTRRSSSCSARSRASSSRARASDSEVLRELEFETGGAPESGRGGSRGLSR